MITIGLEQIKDCDHCSKTYGTLGCCATVSNKWVYSCTEGQKEYIIDRVLEIIDGYKSKAIEPTKLSASTYNILLDRIKRDVFLALKRR